MEGMPLLPGYTFKDITVSGLRKRGNFNLIICFVFMSM